MLTFESLMAAVRIRSGLSGRRPRWAKCFGRKVSQQNKITRYRVIRTKTVGFDFKS